MTLLSPEHIALLDRDKVIAVLEERGWDKPEFGPLRYIKNNHCAFVGNLLQTVLAFSKGEGTSQLEAFLLLTGQKLIGEDEAVVPDGWVLVPKTPSVEHLDSIALRLHHDFGLWSEERKERMRGTARKMYEESTGQGFHEIETPNVRGVLIGEDELAKLEEDRALLDWMDGQFYPDPEASEATTTREAIKAARDAEE